MSSSRRRRDRGSAVLGVVIAVVIIAVGTLFALRQPVDTRAGSDAAAPITVVAGPAVASGAPTAPTDASQLLASLPVKGRAAKTGYDREGRFGTAWFDIDRNGCDTRNDVLQRDLVSPTLSGVCKVLRGTLHDPYTGAVIPFVRGEDTSADVQIDHVVALMDAWQTGAQLLDDQQRVTLANDPLNLIATDGPTNGQKSDADAATWLPPNKGARCAYVARQVAVKATYGLWVTPAEHDAMAAVLQGCPGELAPVSPFAVLAADSGVSGDAPAPASDARPYRSCDAARADGATPLHVGDAGYSRSLDGDGDGTACE